MRLARGREHCPHPLHSRCCPSSVRLPRMRSKRQEDQVGVQHVGFAVAAHTLDAPSARHPIPARRRIPILPGRPSSVAMSVEARRGRDPEGRQHVHQVDVPPVKAAQVVVVAKGRVLVARLPVARRLHAVAQAAVVQHGQVEAAAVPGDECRACSARFRRRSAPPAPPRPLCGSPRLQTLKRRACASRPRSPPRDAVPATGNRRPSARAAA